MKVFFAQLFFVAALASVFAPAQASAWSREFGVDRPGLDYRSYDLASPRMVLCEYRCSVEARCKAWTYVKPGIQGPNARCWLKYAVPRAYKNSCCDSGTK